MIRLRHLLEPSSVAPERVVVFGESLGGSVAAGSPPAIRRPAGHLRQLHFGARDGPGLVSDVSGVPPGALSLRHAGGAPRNCPVLILHSPEDEIIPFSHGQALLAAAREPKRLVELRVGHNDALEVSREVYTREIGAFLQQFLRS